MIFQKGHVLIFLSYTSEMFYEANKQIEIINEFIWKFTCVFNRYMFRIVLRLQILQHGRSCSLQYKLNFSWCSSQCSLISNTYDGNFWYSSIGIVVWFRESFCGIFSFPIVSSVKNKTSSNNEV
jgi:hypothetical protein